MRRSLLVSSEELLKDEITSSSQRSFQLQKLNLNIITSILLRAYIHLHIEVINIL